MGICRVLHIIYSLERGGAERYLMEVLSRYDRRRFAMDVCTMAAEPGAWADRARALGAELTTCRESHLLYPMYRGFARLLARRRYDVLCFHGEQYLACALLAARPTVPGLVAFLHTTQCFGRMAAQHRLYHRWQMQVLRRLQPKIVCASEAIAEAHFGGPLRRQYRVHVVHYGIDAARFASARRERAAARAELNLPPSAAVLGHVGRFHPAKNHAGFVEVARRVAARRADVRFLLVGDGPLRSQIERHIDQAGLADRFVLTGLRPDVERLLAAMDVFVFPSRWEGLPISVLEAQAAGLPVIGSRLPALLEATPPQNQRFLHAAEEHDRLAADVLTMLADQALARRVGDTGSAWVRRNFSVDASVQRFCRLLQASAAPPGKAPLAGQPGEAVR